MLYADLMSGEADLADLAFLVAIILAIVAGILYLVGPPAPPRNIASAFLAFAVGFIALGLLAF